MDEVGQTSPRIHRAEGADRSQPVRTGALSERGARSARPFGSSSGLRPVWTTQSAGSSSHWPGPSGLWRGTAAARSSPCGP